MEYLKLFDELAKLITHMGHASALGDVDDLTKKLQALEKHVESLESENAKLRARNNELTVQLFHRASGSSSS